MLERLFLFAAFIPVFAGAEYLPLDPGNSWTYRQVGGRDEFTIAVSLNQSMIDGNVYHSLRGYVGQPVYVRYSDRGDLVYRDEERNTDVLLTAFAAGERMTFSAPLRPCAEQGEIFSAREPFDGPSGHFSRALVIGYRALDCYDAGVVQERFVESVGMVSRTVQTIAGPRRYDLVSAQAGGVSILERPGTAFHVTVREIQADRASLVLRLRNLTGAPLRLVFPTSQEYDAALYDSAGNEIAVWSSGMVFAQALRERTVRNELCFNVDLQLSRTLPPGAYTLKAWLTSGLGGRTPEFSARVDVQVPAPGTVARSVAAPESRGQAPGAGLRRGQQR